MSKQSKGPGVPKKNGASAAEKQGKMDRAFDIWLRRSLHTLYDDVASEPVPDSLLKLIEDDYKP